MTPPLENPSYAPDHARKTNTKFALYDCPFNCLFSFVAFLRFSQTETCGEVNLHVPRVLNYFRQVITRQDMDKDSALLMNAGAHYVKVFCY